MIIAEFALVNAADAVLTQNGWRVHGVAGAHQARFEFPLLPAVFATNLPLIAEIRRARNEEAYGSTHPVSGAQARSAVDLSDLMVNEVAKLIT